jgi:hypothetical protein
VCIQVWRRDREVGVTVADHGERIQAEEAGSSTGSTGSTSHSRAPLARRMNGPPRRTLFWRGRRLAEVSCE